MSQHRSTSQAGVGCIKIARLFDYSYGKERMIVELAAHVATARDGECGFVRLLNLWNRMLFTDWLLCLLMLKIVLESSLNSMIRSPPY
ncbi:hypothetical protein CEXT_402921 [Caerostris extrusa]|uniref:Uncharacterized protein n=1 Tax=Caerostris extrusa TaxID=172846 RepID=A0AAV4QUF3_CAEEX|nr:hypothetical protein CEXT_402921 [Caerostris extrusa]